MAAFLSAEEGLLKGLVLNFDTGDTWIIGRDPDQTDYVLADTSVSRKHAEIIRQVEGYYLKNLSTTNPITINDEEISGSVKLKDQDKVSIGQTTFIFSEEEGSTEEDFDEDIGESKFDDIFSDLEKPSDEEASDEDSNTDEEQKKKIKDEKSDPKNSSPSIYDTIFEESEDEVPFHLVADSPLILKVISGPNVGAEIGIEKGNSYIIGKDPNSCEIVFQDLSVSRNHSKLTVKENGTFFIEDMQSKNGTRVNGLMIEEEKQITPQDLIACGTTTFVILDREAAQETIYSPSFALEEEIKEEEEEEEEEQEPLEETELPVNWKEKVIPSKYLVAASSFAFIMLVMFISFFSLFKSQQVKPGTINPNQKIASALSKYSDVQFSFNSITGKLFLTGHVLTSVDQKELMYNLHSLDFINSVEDNLIIDELIWKNANDILTENAEWEGINIYAPQAGKFVVSGYLQTLDQKDQLDDFINTHFPHLDMLDDRVYVDQTLNLQIAAMLQTNGFDGVQFQQTNGTVILTGYFNENKASEFDGIVKNIEAVPGIRSIQNIAVPTSESASRIDLTNEYQVTGFAKYDGDNYSIVINGKILTVGDSVDGVDITKIMKDTILLEKDGLKYKINYNQ